MNLLDSIAAARVAGITGQPDGKSVCEFRFTADDPVFAGHFPNRPILPGIFQIEMTRAAAEWALDCPLSINEVCKAKFLRPILPDEVVRMELKVSQESGAIQVRAAFSVNGRPAGEAWLRLCRRE